MMIIRIDTETVRKNPTAGNTAVRVQGPKELTFGCKYNDLPKWLINGENMTILSQERKVNGRIECAVHDPSLYHDLLKEMNIDIHYKNHSEVFHGFPESNYLFKYHNPVIRCAECNALVHSNDIEVEYTDDDDDVRYEKCPMCMGVNTFEQRVFEDINDVVKQNPDLAK